jgi:dipeptidyl-peptidase 4
MSNMPSSPLPALAAQALPAQLVRTRLFTVGVPGQFTIGRNGSAVLFLRSRSAADPVTCLWALDLSAGTPPATPAPTASAGTVPEGTAPAGTERLLADPAELSGTADAAIGAYAADAAGRLIAFALAGKLWVIEAADSADGYGAPRCLPAAGPVTDPRPDPAGQRIAYVSEGAVRVIEADGTGDRLVMAPDGPAVTAGIGEHTGVAAAGGRRGYWWAPDGDRLLVARVDSAGVGLWYVADPGSPAQQPRGVRYAAAGTANAEVTLWVAGLDGSRTEARWDQEAFEYVPGAGWDAHGPFAVVHSRDQRTVRFLAIDAGSGETSVLSEQHDERWVDLVPGLPARTAAGTVLDHASLAGTRQLTADGVPVTPPGLQVREVLGVDGEEVLFTASDDPLVTHLWTYRAGEPGVRRLTDGFAVHTGVRAGGVLVRVARGPDGPGGQIHVLRDGHPAVPVTSLAERPVLDLRATSLILGPRELRATLYLPSWYREGDGQLPILADPYSGAGLQRVTAEVGRHDLVSQWFAEQGFAVLVADGSGTPGRGPEWEREVHGVLFTPVIEDQVSAVHEAARLHPELDLGRVGIRGWSFGGALATLAVLRRPDVFHVAVAGAGVTDQHLYNAYWRERTLGHPDTFPERYQACSLIGEAPNLSRPLLLMHGLADTNVFPVNTLRLSSALLAAGRPHELVLLPGVGHQAMDQPVTESLLRRQVRFLQHHLNVTPRDPAR